MKVLKIEPGKKPEELEVENRLEALQKMVGGYIQAIYPFDEPIAVICNEDGKLLGLEPNRALRDENGKIYDVVCGTMLLCAAPPDSENFESLTDKQIKEYEKKFHCPEVFFRTATGILCIPVEE